MASEVEICNRALQKLGASRIVELTEDTTEARECNAAYAIVRDAELRAHPWSFAVKREVLAPSGPPLVHSEGQTAFQLPSDFLRLLTGRKPDNRDWQIEGRRVLTRFASTQLEVRYVARITDPNKFDPLFIEALACRLAVELCERLTQSNPKWQRVQLQYDQALQEARRANAIERPSAEPPTDDWILARL